MGPLGVQEMIAIFLVALILFGPKKLPELGRTLGKALSEFRRAKNELKNTLETHLNELERESRISDSYAKTSDNYSPAVYPQPYEDYGRRSYDSSLLESAAQAGPYGSTEPHSTALEPSSTVESTAADEGAAAQHLSISESAPVPGTVPRSNGIYPANTVTAPKNQESTL